MKNTCNFKTVFIDNELTFFSKIRFNYQVVLTGPYNVGPSTPHFYIIKLELTRIHIISFVFLFCSKTWMVGTREPPQ